MATVPSGRSDALHQDMPLAFPVKVVLCLPSLLAPTTGIVGEHRKLEVDELGD